MSTTDPERQEPTVDFLSNDMYAVTDRLEAWRREGEAARAAKAGSKAVEAAKQATAIERIDELAQALVPHAISQPSSPIEKFASEAPLAYSRDFSKLIKNLRSRANKLDPGKPISAGLDIRFDDSALPTLLPQLVKGLGVDLPIEDLDSLLLESARSQRFSMNSLLQRGIITHKLTMDEIRQHVLGWDTPIVTFKMPDEETDVIFLKSALPGVLGEVTLSHEAGGQAAFEKPEAIGISLSPVKPTNTQN